MNEHLFCADKINTEGEITATKAEVPSQNYFTSDEEDDDPFLCDELGRPARHEPGFVYDAETLADEDAMRDKAEQRDFQKAELAATYRGGLQAGDVIRLGDRMVVVGDRQASPSS